MKKILLIITIFCMTSVMYAQNIPNRGFENWTIDTLFENTSVWETQLDEFYFPEILTVEKSTDAQEGNYSVRLSNDTINGDTTFGYAIQGGFGDNGPDSGIVYTTEFDSITGWYKNDMIGTDTSIVIVSKFSATDTTFDVFGLGGTHNTWTRFSFPVSSVTGTLTEIFVGFASTNPGIGSLGGVFDPNSWVMLDNIVFTSASSTPDALPDYSFENWYVESYEDAQGWFSLNQFSTLVEDDISVEKTTDAAKGNFAMKITSRYSQIFDDTVGIALNSEISDNLHGGFAFDEIPYSISGVYKYNPATTNDTAIIAVFLSKWDPTGDSTVNVLEDFFLLEPQSTYTAFSFNIDTAGLVLGDFDSVNIIMTSSIYSFDSSAPIGSELFVDDLWLDSKCAYADTTDLWYVDSVVVEDPIPGPNNYAGPSGYVSYLWQNGDTTSYTFLTSGLYTLSVVNNDGCEIYDELYITAIQTGNINGLNTGLLSVYPNPASSVINIDLSKLDASLQKEISISDLSGKQIMRTFVTGQNEVLNINELPLGVYLMNIRIGEELMTFKVVKK